MRYGESTFDILYLLFVIISGIVILVNAGSKAQKYMGMAALILGCGDAFHLIPRVLNYFFEADFTVALGIGKLITSITMTVFYVLLYIIWMEYYQQKENRRLTTVVFGLMAARILLCLLPQNNWIRNDSSIVWGIIRNIPFTILGGIICFLFFIRRMDKKPFRFLWICILFSFLFYIPVAVGAGAVPALGMLMLPKTVCYILVVCMFRSAVSDERKDCSTKR